MLNASGDNKDVAANINKKQLMVMDEYDQ